MNLLFVPHAPWHLPQRARFFAEALAARHEVWVTNADGDFARPAALLTRRYLLNPVPRRWKDENIMVQHVPRLSPALFSARLRRLNDHLYARTLERLIARERIDVVVGTFVAPVPQGVATVTDVFDDNVALWQHYGKNKAYAAEIAAREAAWLESSQAVVTVSSVLKDRVLKDRGLKDRAETGQPRGHDVPVTHIPNGVDLERYVPGKRAARARLGLRQDTRYLANIGALDNKQEVQRLLAVARSIQPLRAVELLVVGRGAAMPHFRREVARRGLERVRFAGFVTGDTLLHFFQAIDVGLCPYEVTPGDSARVPLRLLHYSAVGARVVCTALEEVRRMNFSNVTLSAASPDAFAEAAVAALDLTAEVPAQLAAYDMNYLARRYEEVLASLVA